MQQIYKLFLTVTFIYVPRARNQYSRFIWNNYVSMISQNFFGALLQFRFKFI